MFNAQLSLFECALLDNLLKGEISRLEARLKMIGEKNSPEEFKTMQAEPFERELKECKTLLQKIYAAK